MNWDAAGAISEVVGALAVLMTLIYLAVQIRQNSELAKAQLNTIGFDAFSRYRQMMNAHAGIVARMQKREELSDSESIIAHNIISEALFATAAAYESSKITDPSRTGQFVEVGAALLVRHNWPWESNRRILDVAGYTEFTGRVAATLEKN